MKKKTKNKKPEKFISFYHHTFLLKRKVNKQIFVFCICYSKVFSSPGNLNDSLRSTLIKVVKKIKNKKGM